MAILKIIELPKCPRYLPELKTLLEEYGCYMYQTLGLIAGKDTFFKEVSYLPGTGYEPPLGIYMLALCDGETVGCAGIKKWDNERCELKRMFLRPTARGQGLGRQLCQYAIEKSRSLGYQQMLLDTNAEMKEAVRLYLNCGFKVISPYCINENEHPIFMEYTLSGC